MTCGATPQLPVHVHSCGGSVGQATYQSTLPPISILQQHCLKLGTQGICTINISARGIYLRSIYAHLSWETERTIRCMYSTTVPEQKVTSWTALSAKKGA